MVSEKVAALCYRWKKLGQPETLTPNEFQKALVQSDDINLDYSPFYESGCEIDVSEFLTGLLAACTGNLTDKLKSKSQAGLYELYRSEEELMTPEQFYLCLTKSFKAACETGEVQMPAIDHDAIEALVSKVTHGNALDFPAFRKAMTSECELLAGILQETALYARNLSTMVVENPFPVLPFLQKGQLFLGKYEILKKPEMIDDISSHYKRRYKHAILEVKEMLGERRFSFRLIYLSNIKGDRNFRQNFFREIVLKNKLQQDQVTEFGELPGGILYKSVNDPEHRQNILADYLDSHKKPDQTGRKLVCLSEIEAIQLGLNLLGQLEILHSMQVIHSNISPTSVYTLDDNIEQLKLLDLELSIWEPVKLLDVDSEYFAQYKEDVFDVTYRMESFLSPEHKELAEEYRKTGKIPKHSISMLADIYGVGALIYFALTGEAPQSFCDKTAGIKPRDSLGNYHCPPPLDQLLISNHCCDLLIKVLSKDLAQRYQTIAEMRAGLLDLKGKLETLPPALLSSLEMIPSSVDMFEENYTLDLRSNDINGFVLDYLYKFVADSRVPNISLFSEPLPIRALKTNGLLELDLSSCDVHSEDLKLLSFFLKSNSSLRTLNLSRNPLLTRKQVSSPAEIDSIGFTFFVEALEGHTALEKFQLAGVKLSPHFCDSLCKPLGKNTQIAFLDFSACELGAEGMRLVCQMSQNFPALEVLNLRENSCSNEGANYLSRLLATSGLKDLDISKNGIMSAGAEALGRAISLNFKLQTLNISDNQLTEAEVKLVLDTVFFNTEYVKLKTINEKYGEYGYNLLAESIRKKAKHSKFVYEKLRAKLSNCEDETDRKLAEMLLDVDGNIRLETIPQFYTYNPGDGTVHFFNKK